MNELIWGRLVFPVDKAKTHLGYRPRYDFAAFLVAWQADDPTHYPYGGEPWWGLDES